MNGIRAVWKPNDCWNWIGRKNGQGYGLKSIKRLGRWVTVRAHRLAYESAYGPIPQGLFVCHSCDNESCVNPAHLWLGTNQENQLDMVKKGLRKEGYQKGPKHPTPKQLANLNRGNPGPRRLKR